MSKKINNHFVLLVFAYFSFCSNVQEKRHVVLSSSDDELHCYSISVNDDYFVREKLVLSSSDTCILSSKTESFKLIGDILYIKQNIVQQEVWYPYLLLTSNKGVSFSELLPFASFVITNCLISKTDSTYTIHQVRRVVNGEVEKELLITLNRDWLPIREKELKAPFGEPLKEYSLIKYPTEKIPKGFCK